MRAAGSKDKALEAIHEGDQLLSLHSHGCQPCSMAFRVASASTLAEMGELDQVGRRLDEAERISAMWHGGPWVAAVWEARGIQRRAEKNDARAVSAFEEAASRYASLGRPTDEARCRAPDPGGVRRGLTLAKDGYWFRFTGTTADLLNQKRLLYVETGSGAEDRRPVIALAFDPQHAVNLYHQLFVTLAAADGDAVASLRLTAS